MDSRIPRRLWAQVAGYSWPSGVWDRRCWKCSCDSCSAGAAGALGLGTARFDGKGQLFFQGKMTKLVGGLEHFLFSHLNWECYHPN